MYKNFIIKEGKFDRQLRVDRKTFSPIKKESSHIAIQNLKKKNVTNLNSTAVTNPSERSIINEKCPEVETLKHSILISNNQIQIKRDNNSILKSPDVFKRKNFSVNNTHDSEMDLRMMKHELERDLDL